jgi:hypothetical protein
MDSEKIYVFDAVIIKHEGIDAGYIDFPYNVEEEFGTKGWVKIIAKIDDAEYRGSLAKMGHSCHFLGVTKEIRKKINKTFGDTVHIVIKRDIEIREVIIPQEFEYELSNNPDAFTFFKTLSYTNKKEYVQWIMSAKKEETKQRRIHKAIEMLLSKKKEPN